MIHADSLQVYVDLEGVTVPAGRAQFHRNRGTLSSTTFQYDPAYLERRSAYALDPALELVTGSQHVPGLPGAFSDCAPDRWGRNLIAKRERAVAERGSRLEPTLDDVDYLVGVGDITRQGALRFRPGDDGPFVAPGHSVPKLIKLPALLRASDAVARGQDLDDYEPITALLSAGSGSLGGARPKASVADDDGRQLIVKFPHPDDEWDVLAWEATALDLAAAAGVPVPQHRLTQVGGRHVLLLERFDRTPASSRIGYMSAMTLLEKHDGDSGDYVDIAEQYTGNFGARPNDDLLQLFRRAAVSVGIHNTDDHLRNHGFVRGRGGWVLSPAFDVNPNPKAARRQTTIAGADEPGLEADGLLELGRACRLTRTMIADELRHISGVLGSWQDAAKRNGVRPGELERFERVLARGQEVLREATPHSTPHQEGRAERFKTRSEPRNVELDRHGLNDVSSDARGGDLEH